MCEILAPAGDQDSFYAAIHSGADAIYVGLKEFSARKSAANFALSEIGEHIRYAHVLGVKVYVALNTLVKDRELDSFFSCALGAWNAGADGLILQDVFLGKALKELYPQMVLHLSTQAGVCNVYGAQLAKGYGFSRVILARETPLSDVQKIAAEIETEVFVQGALCSCFSGQCYFSAFAGGNSGNRGLCKQPCRKKYSVDKEGEEGFSYKISLSDLCAANDVEALVQAGVSSLKVEGRMRSAAYVGSAVRYYRDIIDENISRIGESFSDLKRAYNRGNYTKGYFAGQDKNLLSRAVQGHIGERVGKIIKADRGSKYVLVGSDYLPAENDGFKILRFTFKNAAQSVRKSAPEEKKASVRQEDRERAKEDSLEDRLEDRLEVGGGQYHGFFPKAQKGFTLFNSGNFQVGDEVYLTSDARLAERVAKRKRSLPLVVSGRVCEGKPMQVRVSGGFGTLDFVSEFTVQAAQSRAFSRQDFVDCFLKTDTYPFSAACDCEIIGECFVVKSALNEFRRQIYAKVFASCAAPREPLAAADLRGYLEKTEKAALSSACAGQEAEEGERIAAIDDAFQHGAFGGTCLAYAIVKPADYRDTAQIYKVCARAREVSKQVLLYLPAFCVGEDLKAIGQVSEQFDGIYADGVYAIEYCREKSLPLFAGTGWNLFNRLSALSALCGGAKEIALSKELSVREAKEMDLPSAFLLAGGSIKVMDLGHCLFGKDCKNCDRRRKYSLTDESGRVFPLLRYQNSCCRFEIYNCALLKSEGIQNRLLDFTALSQEEKSAYLRGENGSSDKKKYTAGLLRGGVV